VADPEPDPPVHRRVRRGEGGGEVTQWPRGVVGYVPAGPADETPSPEEDRTANRVKLAARLLSVLRSQGRPVDGLIPRLRAAEDAVASGDRARATALVDRLIADLDRASGDGPQGAAARA
jgi:hypothetical protein